LGRGEKAEDLLDGARLRGEMEEGGKNQVLDEESFSQRTVLLTRNTEKKELLEWGVGHILN